MSFNTEASVQQIPIIDVKYENIKPENTVISVDGKKLGQVLTEIGYPKSVLKNLIITDSEPLSPHTIARFDPYINRVMICQDGLINDVKSIYRQVLQAIGEETPQQIAEKNDIASKVMRSKAFRTVFPVFWAYNMLKRTEVSYLQGNQDRYRRYFNAAKDGTLMPGKPLREQRERAKKHLGKLMEYGMQSSTSWILAHEYEHANKRLNKNVIIAALGAAPLVLGSSMLFAIDLVLRQQGHVLPEDASIGGIVVMLGGLLFGVAKGRSFDEQASFDAGDKNFRKIMDCFHINHEVFANEILGEK